MQREVISRRDAEQARNRDKTAPIDTRSDAVEDHGEAEKEPDGYKDRLVKYIRLK